MQRLENLLWAILALLTIASLATLYGALSGLPWNGPDVFIGASIFVLPMSHTADLRKAVLSAAIDTALERGGCTVPFDGVPNDRPYVVGLYGLKVPAVLFDYDTVKACDLLIRDFLRMHKDTQLYRLSGKTAPQGFGLWMQDGYMHFDAIIFVQSEKIAHSFARLYKQDSIYNLDTGETIPTAPIPNA